MSEHLALKGPIVSLIARGMALIASGTAGSTFGVVLAVAAAVVASCLPAGASADRLDALVLLCYGGMLADNGLCFQVSDIGRDKLSQDWGHAVTRTLPAGMMALPRCKQEKNKNVNCRLQR